MPYLLLLLFVFIGVGCNEASKPYEYRAWSEQQCRSEHDRMALADYIVKCAAAANPKSDEEGEDLVMQCEESMKRSFCPTIKLCRWSRWHNRNWLKGPTRTDCDLLQEEVKEMNKELESGKERQE